MKTAKLTKRAFKTWLEEKGEGEMVGQRRCLCLCPIAKAIEELFDYPLVIVAAKYAELYNETTDEECTTIKLPRWAIDFIKRIDNPPRDQGTLVLAHEALRALK